MNQKEMLALLKQYEETYYAEEPIVTDEEYDALKDKYVKKFGEYEHVPSEGTTGFTRVKHMYPLKSLDKIQLSDKDKLRKELERLWPVVIQPKFDGLSIEIQPYSKFITRGNGEEGDDVSSQCLRIEGADLIAPGKTSAYRAEILMTHSDFKTLNKKRTEDGLELFSNCRNAASGMLRNLDLDKVQGLTIMLYEDLGNNKSQSSIVTNLTEELEEQLEYIDVRVTPIYKPVDIDAAITFLNSLEDYRKLIDYDIDGWVVKSDIENSLKIHGGYTGHHPKNAFAVKGEAKGAWTQINSITWQVGKENITPVAELSPVLIEGSTISRATLHNISFIKALELSTIYCDLYHKTEVYVVKANDVIPRITEVRHIISEGHNELNGYMDTSVNPPGVCPACGGKTAIKETDSDSQVLICINPNCEAKIKARAEQMASRQAFDIKGLSEGTIDKLFSTYDIDNHVEILNITVDEILELEGYATKSANQLYKAIQTVIASQPLDKVIYAASIPLIGKDTATLIAKKYTAQDLGNILSKQEKDAIKDLCKIKGIGKETAKSFVKNKGLYESMSAAVIKVVDIAVPESNKEQKSFCITGQREPFKTIIETSGHKVSGSISKKTTALIAADGDLTTSKAIKAIELKIPIIKTEEELRVLL